MAEVNIDVAKEASVQTVNTTVNTINTNASTAVSNTAYSATASSTGSLSQKLAYIISTLVGATNSTGGTTTAGTVMAKLNALLTWFTGTWTAARAGYIDNVRSYTITNNTASTTGILSQKLSYLAEHSGNIYVVASSTRQENKISSQVDVDSYCGYQSYPLSRLMSFTCLSSGTVRMSVSAKQLISSSTNVCNFQIYDITTASQVAYLDMGSNVATFTVKTVDFPFIEGHTYGIAMGRTNGDTAGRYVSCNDLTFCYTRQQGAGNFSVTSI